MPRHKIGTRSEVVDSLIKIVDNHRQQAELDGEDMNTNPETSACIIGELNDILKEMHYIKELVELREDRGD